jgi:hypothetical protein
MPTPTVTPKPMPTHTPIPTPTPTLRTAETPVLIPIVIGPIDGVLTHNEDDNFVKVFASEVNFADVVAEVTFSNPYPTSVGSWSYGFLFRRQANVNFHAVAIRSDGTWEHRLLTDSTYEPTLVEETSASIDTTPDDSNHLKILALGEFGALFINGSYIGALDLSGLTGTGDVNVMTGFGVGDQVNGELTGFEDFAVWSIFR